MKKRFNYDQVPVLSTTSGKLKGYYYKGEYIFKGVPYASAERFHAPVPAKWDGIMEATSYGYVCPLMDKDKPNGELLVPHRYWVQDENCQNLNIWTRELDPEGEKKLKKPVLVWLHGGGYFAGSSIEQAAYDGFNLCKKGDVVVVSLNHRLNILGYLDLSAYGEEYKNSANAGHADMLMALKWIQENIHLFGGDPDNVTLFGQSGGGAKIIDLMQIPEADGYFHKGLIMSGVMDHSDSTESADDGKALIEAMMKELGVNDVKQLETIPYFLLSEAYKKVMPAIASQGLYTGNEPRKNDFYLGDPLIHGFREKAYQIPLMIGTVYAEFSFVDKTIDKYALSEEACLAFLKNIYKEGTEEVVTAYKKAYPGKCLMDLSAIDRCMREPSKMLAGLHAAGGGINFLYLFNQEFPIYGGKVAWHCADIPFVFANTALVETCDFDGAEELENQISTAFISFARTNDPNNSLLPDWASTNRDCQPTMIFDRSCEVRNNFDDKLFEEINKVLPPFSFFAVMDNEEIQH